MRQPRPKRITVDAMLNLKERYRVDLLAPDEALIALDDKRTLRRVLRRLGIKWGIGELFASWQESLPEAGPKKRKKAAHGVATIDPWQLVFELAGSVGVDPRPFTVRELVYRSKGAGLQDWNQTSSLLAMIHNVNCSRGRKKKPDDMNPYAEKSNRRKVNLQFLRDLKEEFGNG